jgi:hypothetical protein
MRDLGALADSSVERKSANGGTRHASSGRPEPRLRGRDSSRWAGSPREARPWLLIDRGPRGAASATQGRRGCGPSSAPRAACRPSGNRDKVTSGDAPGAGARVVTRPWWRRPEPPREAPRRHCAVIEPALAAMAAWLGSRPGRSGPSAPPATGAGRDARCGRPLRVELTESCRSPGSNVDRSALFGFYREAFGLEDGGAAPARPR